MAKIIQNYQIKNETKHNMTRNNEGAVAYAMSDKEKLITQVLTTFFNESKFYGDNSEDLVETARKILDSSPSFVANLAVYARTQMHLRTVSQVLLAELAKHNNGKKFVRETSKHMLIRPDDLTETLNYYISTFGKPIANSLKKGLSNALLNFDEYQLAKYSKKRKYTCGKCNSDIEFIEIKKPYCKKCGWADNLKIANAVLLKDVALLTNTKRLAESKGSKQLDLINRLITDNLKVPKTWETQLSTKGNNKETWEQLIASKKLGYMAALRNLKNIIQANPKNIELVYELLKDKKAVLNSKQLPFRFVNAYDKLIREFLATSKILNVLEEAIKHSCENIKKIPGKSLIAIDVSASMSYNISSKSQTKPSDIARVLAAIANNICEDAVIVTFDTKLKEYVLPSTNGIISNSKSIDFDGGGTDITLPIIYALERRRMKFDRIIMFSDNEINDRFQNQYGYFSSSRDVTNCQQYFEKYLNEVNPDCWLHGVDLQGYGTQQFRGRNVNMISGWSEKVLDFIVLAEEGKTKLLNTIENYIFEKD